MHFMVITEITINKKNTVVGEERMIVLESLGNLSSIILFFLHRTVFPDQSKCI